MAIIFLLNFVMPVVWHCSYADKVKDSVKSSIGKIGPSGGTISLTEGVDIMHSGNTYAVIPVQVSESGLYEVSFAYGGTPTDFDIANGEKPLAVAGKTSDQNIPGSCNRTQRKVSVYLKAGTTYNFVTYQRVSTNDSGGTGNKFEVKISDKKAEPSDIVEYDVSSAEFTNVGHQGNSHEVEGVKVDHSDGSISYGSSSNHRTASITPTGNFSDEMLSGKQASTLQKLVVWFFVSGICEQLRAIINAMFGPVTIDDILFNRYNGTRLSFYSENGKDDPNRANQFLVNAEASKTVLEVISEYYNYFRGIAILLYVILLLYVGVRIITKSTAGDRDKYKTMLTDWAKGVLIMFIFPMIIKYSILINEALVKLVAEIASGVDSSYMPSSATESEAMNILGVQMDNHADDNIMAKYKQYALDSGSLGFAFVYFYLVMSILSFLLIYFKRLITIIFLIVLFPFVVITYAIDKIKDGTAQVFNNWFKELMLNIFMQLFHAISYLVVTTIITAIMAGDTPNIVLVIIGLGYVKKSDELLKILFPRVMRGGGAGTVKGASQVMQVAQTVGTINSIKGQAKSVVGRYKNTRDRISEFRGDHYESRHRNNLIKLGEENAKAEQNQLADIDNLGNLTLQNAGLELAGAAIPLSGNNNPGGNRAPSGNTAPGGNASQNGSTQNSGNAGGNNSNAGGNGVPLSDNTTQLIQKMAQAYELPGGKSKVMAKIDGVANLTDAQKQRLKQMVDQQAVAQRALNEVMSGKNKAGKQLTKLQLSMQVKVLHDLINSPEAELSGTTAYLVKKQLQQSQVTVEKTRYFNGSKEYQNGTFSGTAKEQFLQAKARAELIPDEDKRKRALARFTTKTDKVGMSAYDYLEKELAKGVALDSQQLEQANKANAWVGNTTGVRIAQNQNGALVDSLNPAYDADGETDVSSARAGKVSKEGLNLGNMSSKQRKNLEKRNIDTINELTEQFAADSDEVGRQRAEEAAKHIVALRDYERRRNLSASDREHIDGVDPEEMLRITSRLNKLRQQDENVAKMLETTMGVQTAGMVASANPGAGFVTSSGDTVKVDLGTTLDTLEAASATAILSTPQSELDEDSRGAIQQAAESLRRVNEETEDDTALAFVNRSEHDDILEAEDLGDAVDAYLYSDNKTQEEIKQEKFVEEKVNLRIQLSDTAMSQLRTKMIADGLRAAGATVNLTAGTILEASAGIAGTAMVAGASAETSGRNLATTFTTTSQVERLASKLVAGSYGSRDSSLGNMAVNAVENIGKSRRENKPLEKNSAEQKVIVDNAKAAARAQTIRNKFKSS